MTGTAEAAGATRALLMCAAHCQGGHSDAGAAAAAALGTPFPVTMANLEIAARRLGHDPDELWPWLRRMRERRNEGTASMDDSRSMPTAPDTTALLMRAIEALRPFAKAGELFIDKPPIEGGECIYAPAAGREYALDGQQLRRAHEVYALITEGSRP